MALLPSPSLLLSGTSMRVKDFTVSRLKAAGQDETFLSRENLRLLQQSFGPLFRELDKEHPRMSQVAVDLVPVDLTAMPRQSFSETMLKEHGSLWIVRDGPAPYGGQELHLWEQYQRFRRQFAEFGDEAGESAKAIAPRIREVDLPKFRLPWNVLYASHEPEREFSMLLFENAALFDAFVKMPNVGGYAFPYSYKPAKAAKTHTANENFNPDFFIRVLGTHDILVVEVKAEADDSNRNRAKCRDGLEHFETLNARLREEGELWHYDFYFLSPENYTSFFEQVRNRTYTAWRSGLMQELVG